MVFLELLASGQTAFRVIISHHTEYTAASKNRTPLTFKAAALAPVFTFFRPMGPPMQRKAMLTKALALTGLTDGSEERR